MKRIILSFFVLMMIAVGASAQNYTYLLNHVVDGGNPGGVYTDADASTTGWTQVIAPTQAANSWSDTVGIPFPFSFYGTPVTHFKMSGNGVMTFDTSVTTVAGVPSNINTNLPAPAGANIPNNSILGFWDSFSASAPLGTNDRVWMKTFGTAPNRQLWVQYFSYEYGSTGSAQVSSFTYWAIGIEEGTNKVFVLDKNYHNGGANLTTTIGVQKDAGVAVQFADSLVGMGAGSTGTADNDYYEFTPLLLVNDNTGITSIDAPAAPLVTGLQNVDVTLKNHGQNALTSATIGWSVNGVVQTPFSWTGNLASQNSTMPITLGQYNFVVGNSTIEAWTSLPNGMADADPSNDTTSTTLCTALAGTFSVGGTGANYPDVGAALAALSNCGISGPITLNVASGTYNGALYVGNIFGLDATNTITVNGAGMANTIISYDGTGTQNAALLLEGAEYITFKNMTIENTKTATPSWGVRMFNNTNHVTFDSCKISTYNTATSSTVACVIATSTATSAFSYANNANDITISNSELNGGYYGVRFNGVAGTSGSGYNSNNKVLNTRVVDHYAYGIYGIYQDSMQVKNCVTEPSRATFGYGVYATQHRNPQIIGNWVKECPSYGIAVLSTNTGSQGYTSGRARVTNNMVTSIGAGEGLYFSTFNNGDVFHNSVHSTDESALYVSGNSTNMDFRNNIFYTTNNLTVDFLTALSATAVFDYNMIYREGNGDLAEDGSTKFADLAAWKSAQPARNASSIEGNPNYVDVPNYDLHVNVGPGLVAGDNTVGVMTDFDGDARPLAPTTVVDMGADEIFVQNIDAGIVSFDAPLPPVVVGLNAIQVSIKNNGIVPLTTATINWSADGVIQTPFAWTGNLAIGEEANGVTIGNFNILTGFTQFQVWTSAPNGGVDGNTGNDTLVYDLCSPLSGTVNVGGATPDFATIADAADAMAFCGVSGAVTVAIAPGTYTDAIRLEEAPGASNTNTITFDGGNINNVHIKYSKTENQNAAILFDGGDFYTFKNMTIENDGGVNYSWTIRLTNGADNNRIEDSKIIADTVSTSSLVGLPILASASATSNSSYGNNANNLTIKNNEILGGYYGIRLNGGSGSQGALNTGNSIEGNTFSRQRFYAVNTAYQDAFEAIGNHISNMNNTSGYGIYCFQTMLSSIEENTIIDVGTYGIGLSTVNYAYSAGKPSVIANNMVKARGTGDGIYMINAESLNIYHNTFYAENDQAFYAAGVNVNNVDIKNNIFVSETKSTIDFTSGIQSTVTFGNNLYYRVDGGNLIEDGSAVATQYASLAAWLVGAPTLNAGSVEGDPLFKDAANGDLHLIGAFANDAGDNTVGITVDVDGDARPEAPSTTVDIGADEYTPLVNDLELLEIFVKPNSCNLPTDSVWAVIRSLGLAPATILNTTTIVTGAISTTLNTPVATNLQLGLSDTVYIGSFNSSAGGIFNISASLTYANDQNTSNDTSGMIMVQRMSAPTATITDVACLGDSTGSIALDFVGTGTIATVDETIQQVAAANMSYSFTGLQGISGITVEVTGMGDIDGTAGNLEAYDIYDENGIFVTQYGAFGTGFQCAPAPLTITSIPDTTYMNWAADGVVTFTAVPTSAVNVTLCNAGQGGNWLEITLAGNGAPDILWSNGDTTDVATGLASGTYTVTATDLLGCVQSATFTVGSATNPTPTLTVGSVTDISCFGANDGAINVSATGGTGTLNYNWSNNSTTQNLSNLSAGMYNVVVSDVNGCTDSSSTGIMINEPDSLQGSVSYTIVNCDSVNIIASLTGGTMPYGYSWNNGSIDTTIQVGSGTYNLTVTDANGCVETGTVTTTLPTALGISTTVMASDTAGAGVGVASVTATDGTAPYTYLWSNGTTTAMASGLTGGNYTVTVTDANGCSQTEMVTVPFPTSANNWSVVSAIEMFPNPTNGLVTFNVEMKSTADLTITIFNVAGQEMTSFQNSNASQVMRKYDTSLLADGVYMVRFVAGDDVVTKRLVVRK